MSTPNGTVHPVADLFPMLDATELKELAEDIANNGLVHPIVLTPDGTLLDGRNRLAACDIAGVNPTFTTYAGDDPIAFVMSVNVQRRHLTVGQKAALALEVLPHYEAQARERQRLAGAEHGRGQAEKQCADLRTPNRSVEEAGKAVGVSGRAVQQFKRVAEKAPELAEKVKTGTMALDAAERAVKAEADRQRRETEAAAWKAELDAQQDMFNQIEPDPEDDWKRREHTELHLVGLIRELRRFTSNVTIDDVAYAFDTGFEHVVRNTKAELRELLPLLNTYRKVVE